MLLAAGQQAQAQFSLGVRGGIISSTAQFSEDLGFEFDNRLGALGGVVAEIRLNEGFAIQPELNYVQRGWQSTVLLNFLLFSTETVTKTRINYVELPILLKAGFNFGPARLDLLAGPSFSKAISGKNDVTNTTTTFLSNDKDVDKSSSEIEFDNDFKKNDLNAQLGLSLSFGSNNNRLFVDGRYLYGIANINDNNALNADISNRGFVVSAGLLHAF